MTQSTTRQKSPLPPKDGNPAQPPSLPPRESTASPDNGSDGDSSGEKPVRKQLRETTIEGRPTSSEGNSDHDIPDAPADAGDLRGRLRRKRSVEEMVGQDDNPAKPEKHVRKRSRDHDGDQGEHAVSTEHGKAANGRASTPTAMDVHSSEDDSTNPLASPKNKRNRDEYLEGQALKGDADAQKAVPGKPTEQKGPSAEAPTPDGRQAKRARDHDSVADATATGKAVSDTAKERAQSPEKKVPASSGFANYSAASPFASLVSDKKPAAQTSASAFASSGFGKLASSDSSPFGALGSTTSKSPSPFASMAPSSTAPSTTTSTFAAPQGDSKSPFGTLGGGLGASKLGAGFGGGAFGSGFAALGKGPGLSSFAGDGAGGIVGLSAKPEKPFGTAAADEKDEAEDEDGDEEEETAPSKDVEEKKDKRFFERTVETGEEGETTEFTCRAKLYAFHKDPKGDAAWKERGTGSLRLNTSDADGKPSIKKARLILRVDGTHNLVLNAPIFKGFQFNGVNSDKPKDGRIVFYTFSQGEDGIETTTMQLRVKAQNGEELWELVQDLKAQME